MQIQEELAEDTFREVQKMSMHKIEQFLERALPYLVGFLALIVAILFPLAISTYLQISTKGKRNSKVVKSH